MPRKTYRSAQGFRDWAFDNGLEVATQGEDEEFFQLYVECPIAMLVVTFAKVDSRVYDVALHVENGPTHQLGMHNTLSTLNQVFLRHLRAGRTKENAS